MQLSEMGGDHTFNLPVPAMAAAGTDREDVLMRVPFNMTITAVEFVPVAAVTANGTNYTTLSVRNRKTDASGSALPASRSYASGNASAWVPDAATISGTAADVQVAAGDVLTVQQIHSGTGIQLPGGTLRITARIR